MKTPQAMIDWLTGELRQRGISMAEASRRAGLASNAISQIMNGQQPGLQVCKGLAKFFDIPLVDMLVMAGHLEPADAAANYASEAGVEASEIVDMLKRMSPKARRRAIRLLNFLAEELGEEK